MKPEYQPPLIAPPFESFDPESFRAHVGALKRAPQRKAPAKPPRPKALKGKVLKGTRTLELSCGQLTHLMPFVEVRSGRRLMRSAKRSAIFNAALFLAQPLERIELWLLAHRFTIENAQELQSPSSQGDHDHGTIQESAGEAAAGAGAAGSRAATATRASSVP